MSVDTVGCSHRWRMQRVGVSCQRAQELIEKKDSIEAEIKAQNDILEGVSRKCDIFCFD